MHRLWRFLTTSRYTHSLELEVARLLGENRNLINALLSAKGLPMLPSGEPDKPLPHMKPRLLPSQWKAKMEKFTGDKSA